jgi:hypothetical protein
MAMPGIIFLMTRLIAEPTFWGEDGLGGISDFFQNLCFSVALWNGKDPILKERLFGLGNTEGNHGEDVKELYYYLDNLPTHYYMEYLYKYPQQEFPYKKLLEENRKRSREEPEYEILDTGVFDNDEYFDVRSVTPNKMPGTFLSGSISITGMIKRRISRFCQRCGFTTGGSMTGWRKSR